jgi:hypothetical protein
VWPQRQCRYQQSWATHSPPQTACRPARVHCERQLTTVATTRKWEQSERGPIIWRKHKLTLFCSTLYLILWCESTPVQCNNLCNRDLAVEIVLSPRRGRKRLEFSPSRKKSWSGGTTQYTRCTVSAVDKLSQSDWLSLLARVSCTPWKQLSRYGNRLHYAFNSIPSILPFPVDYVGHRHSTKSIINFIARNRSCVSQPH